MPKAWGIEAEAMQERADLFFIYFFFFNFNEYPNGSCKFQNDLKKYEPISTNEMITFIHFERTLFLTAALELL